MSQNFFQIIRPVHVHLKTDKVDLKKRPPWKKKNFHFFSIDSSSRHEKRCQMLQRLFWLFQCSKNPQWHVRSVLYLAHIRRNLWHTTICRFLMIEIWKSDRFKPTSLKFQTKEVNESMLMSLLAKSSAICMSAGQDRKLFIMLPKHVFKVHIFWEGHKILRNLPLTFDCMYCSQKKDRRFRKILWPSQNIWTLQSWS